MNAAVVVAGALVALGGAALRAVPALPHDGLRARVYARFPRAAALHDARTALAESGELDRREGAGEIDALFPLLRREFGADDGEPATIRVARGEIRAGFGTDRAWTRKVDDPAGRVDALVARELRDYFAGTGTLLFVSGSVVAGAGLLL